MLYTWNHSIYWQYDNRPKFFVTNDIPTNISNQSDSVSTVISCLVTFRISSHLFLLLHSVTNRKRQFRDGRTDVLIYKRLWTNAVSSAMGENLSDKACACASYVIKHLIGFSSFVLRCYDLLLRPYKLSLLFLIIYANTMQHLLNAIYYILHVLIYIFNIFLFLFCENPNDILH